MGVHEGEEGYGERGGGRVLRKKITTTKPDKQQHPLSSATLSHPRPPPPPPPQHVSFKNTQDETVPFKVLNKLTGAVSPRGLIGPV